MTLTLVGAAEPPEGGAVAAMARAIDRAAVDMLAEIDAARHAVEDFKRVGLTAEDIERDSDLLARALLSTGQSSGFVGGLWHMPDLA